MIGFFNEKDTEEKLMSNNAIFNMITQIRTRAIEDLYNGKFNYSSTMPLLLRQLDILNELGDETHIGDLYHSLAIIELELGNYDVALEHFRAALSAFESAGQTTRYSKSLCGLGELYRETDEIEKAADCFQHSREIAEAENDTRIVIYNYSNEGQLWLAAGQTDRAIELLEMGKSVIDRADWLSDLRHKVLPEILISLAEAYALREDYETAWTSIERGRQLASKSNELHQMAHAYQSMTRIAIAEGRPDVETVAYFEKSAELWRQLGVLPDLGRLLIAAGEYMTNKNELARAEHLFSEAIEAFERANLDNEAATARLKVSEIQ